MTVRIFLGGERIGPQLRRSATKNLAKVIAAERGAVQDVVEYVMPRARQDITGAGKFGTRWTAGFQATVTQGGGFIRVDFTEKVPYWRVFQFGAIIRGKPLLAIPLSFAHDAQGVRARDYPGKLFRVNRKSGAPLLLSVSDRQPKYVLKESVKIPKKFHLLEIIRDGAKKLRGFYSARMKEK